MQHILLISVYTLNVQIIIMENYILSAYSEYIISGLSKFNFPGVNFAFLDILVFPHFPVILLFSHFKKTSNFKIFLYAQWAWQNRSWACLGMTKYILLTVHLSNNYLECINVLVQSYQMMPKRCFCPRDSGPMVLHYAYH